MARPTLIGRALFLLYLVAFAASLHAAGTVSIDIGKVRIAHDTHRSVEPWWEKGTAWEGKPALTVYTPITTRGLGGKKLDVEITLHNADGSLVRWQKGAPSFTTGNDGALRPWWSDYPPNDSFHYAGFRIPLPYAAIDAHSLRSDLLTLRVRAWHGDVTAVGTTVLPLTDILGRVLATRASSPAVAAAPSLQIDQIVVEPARVAPGGRFTLSVLFTARDPDASRRDLPVQFTYRILRDGEALFSKPMVSVIGNNGQATRIRKSGLRAATAHGRYTLEATLDYGGVSRVSRAHFEIGP